MKAIPKITWQEPRVVRKYNSDTGEPYEIRYIVGMCGPIPLVEIKTEPRREYCMGGGHVMQLASEITKRVHITSSNFCIPVVDIPVDDHDPEYLMKRAEKMIRDDWLNLEFMPVEESAAVAGQ